MFKFLNTFMTKIYIFTLTYEYILTPLNKHFIFFTENIYAISLHVLLHYIHTHTITRIYLYIFNKHFYFYFLFSKCLCYHSSISLHILLLIFITINLKIYTPLTYDYILSLLGHLGFLQIMVGY